MRAIIILGNASVLASIGICLLQIINHMGRYQNDKMDASFFVDNENDNIELKEGNENITISNIEVLLDNKATYFTKDFLEISPIYTDEYNTETMVSTTLQLIDNCFKKKYPQG